MTSGQEYGASHPDDAEGQDLPVCPRHPDRVAYVRCQRCGRPACPQCQRPAEVGIRCVDCVNEARRDVPAQHRPARFTDKRGQPIPIVTYVLIAVCALVYAGQWATSLITGTAFDLTETWWYAGVYTSAVSLDGYLSSALGIGFEPWRMITSAFLHSLSNPLHLVLNMAVLWMMGRILEPALGWARFLAVYLISALGGSLAVLLFADPFAPVVGASGAVYGLFAALFFLIRRVGGSVVSIGALIAVNLVISFTWSGISWQAHVGGLVTGAVCALVLFMMPGQRKPKVFTGVETANRQREKVRRLQWLGLAGVVLVLLVATGIGATQITAESVMNSMGG